MQARKLVGQHDMMLSSAIGDSKWVRTRLIQKGDRSVRAVYMTECEVNDPQRFGYLNGSWWKLEASDYEAQEPRRQQFEDDLGSYTLIECNSSDPDKLFYTQGSYWKQER